MPKCQHCNDFGRLQIYRYGRVLSVYCDCSVGDAAIKRAGIPNWKPKRLSDYPTLKDYYKG